MELYHGTLNRKKIILKDCVSEIACGKTVVNLVLFWVFIYIKKYNSGERETRA